MTYTIQYTSSSGSVVDSGTIVQDIINILVAWEDESFNSDYNNRFTRVDWDVAAERLRVTIAVESVPDSTDVATALGALQSALDTINDQHSTDFPSATDEADVNLG